MKKVTVYIILLLVIVASLYSYFILGNQLRAMRGVSMGSKYVNNLYSDYSIAGKNCQGEDTNSDGYITCNFRLKSNSARPDNTFEEKNVILQCPTFIKSFLATSCKENGITINQN